MCIYSTLHLGCRYGHPAGDSADGLWCDLDGGHGPGYEQIFCAVLKHFQAFYCSLSVSFQCYQLIVLHVIFWNYLLDFSKSLCSLYVLKTDYTLNKQCHESSFFISQCDKSSEIGNTIPSTDWEATY